MQSNLKAELEAKGFIVTMTEGRSMLPLIRSGQDAVHVKKKESRPQKGDVVLYKRENGQLVLHRIMSDKKEGYTLCGDHQAFLEKGIQEEQILGVMAGFFRNNRYIDCTHWGYLFYSFLCCSLYPLRRLAAGLASRLQKSFSFSGKRKSSLIWLSQMIGAEKKNLLCLALLNLLQGLVFPGIALLLKSIIDAGVGNRQQALLHFSGLLLVLIILQVLLHAANSWISVKSTTAIKKNIRLQTFSSVLKSDYLSISQYHSGEIVNRILWDTDRISNTLVDALPNTILKGTQLFMMVLYLFFLNKGLALAGMVYGGVSMIILYFSRKAVRRLYGETRKEEGRLFSYFQESIANILLVKGAGLYETMEEKAMIREDSLLEKTRSQNQFSIKVHSAIEFLLRFGFVFLVIWCAFAVSQGRLSPGALTALALMSVQVQSQLLGVSLSVTYFISMMASADRLRELIEMEKEADAVDREASVSSLDLHREMKGIFLKDVCYAYDGRLVLDQASLQIEKGEFVAITGASGIGKSTFMRLLLGVITPSSGQVLFGNVKAGCSTRPLLAYVPQDSALLSGTIRDNITLFCRDARETEIQDALACSCALDFVEALPKGLETEIGEQGTGLSAGQVQRLAIARALLCQAPILLLDEGTSALDEETERQVLKNLKSLKDKTVISITHRQGALQLANSHYTIVNGHFLKIE